MNTRVPFLRKAFSEISMYEGIGRFHTVRGRKERARSFRRQDVHPGRCGFNTRWT